MYNYITKNYAKYDKMIMLRFSKSTMILIFGIVIALVLIYFVGSGFMKNSAVYIADYSVSADGKEITINAGVFTSIGYIRDVKAHQQYGGKLCLDFYSAFGGLSGKIGAKDSLVKAEDGTWKLLH